MFIVNKMNAIKYGYIGIIALTLFKVSEALDCAPNQHNLNGLRCCTKCEEGQGTFSTCNRVNDTVCEPCRRGETFSNSPSHDQQCEPCKICPQYSHVRRQCNETHDTECECDRNYYWNEDTQSCRQCQVCAMGSGMRRRCEKNSDTACRPCQQGTYSDEISLKECKLCTRCDPTYEYMARMCDTMQDTVCEPFTAPTISIAPKRPPPTVIITETESPVPEQQNKTDTKSILIPVCIGGLVLIIIIAVIYAIYRQVKIHRNPPNSPNNKKNISYSAVNDPLQTANLVNAGVSTQQGSDSGVSMEQEPKSTTRIRDLPQVKLLNIGAMLHGCVDNIGNWTSFAKELGYSSSAIASFETRASQAGYKPADLVIAEWSNNETATVEALVQVLKSIGREDVIAVIFTGPINMQTPQKMLPQHMSQNIPTMGQPQQSYSPHLMQVAPGYLQQAPPNMYGHAQQQTMGAVPQQMMHPAHQQNYSQQMVPMGPPQNYNHQSISPPPPHMVQNMTQPPQIYPPHQVINDPQNAGPPPVYRQGAPSHSSDSASGSLSPGGSQASGPRNHQPMHTQPTTQGQHIV